MLLLFTFFSIWHFHRLFECKDEIRLNSFNVFFIEIRIKLNKLKNTLLLLAIITIRQKREKNLSHTE